MGCVEDMWYVARYVGGGRRSGCRSHPQSVERLEELEENVECWVTKMNVEIAVGIKQYWTLVRPALDERGRDIEEGAGKEIGGRRNMNATMDVRTWCGATKLDRIRIEIIRESTKCERRRNSCGHNDEKRRPLPRKKGDGNGSTSDVEETKV